MRPPVAFTVRTRIRTVMSLLLTGMIVPRYCDPVKRINVVLPSLLALGQLNAALNDVPQNMTVLSSLTVWLLADVPLNVSNDHVVLCDTVGVAVAVAVKVIVAVLVRVAVAVFVAVAVGSRDRG